MSQLDSDWQDFLVVGGVQVAVIGLDDLRTNKHAVGRLQDLADLEQLQNAASARPGDPHAQD